MQNNLVCNVIVRRTCIPYSGKLSKEKINFHKFQGFVVIRKSFLRKIWGHGVLWQYQRTIHKSFLCENLISHQFAKVFSSESFPLYGIHKDYCTSRSVCRYVHTTSMSVYSTWHRAVWLALVSRRRDWMVEQWRLQLPSAAGSPEEKKRDNPPWCSV